jgi:hypothetical protein
MLAVASKGTEMRASNSDRLSAVVARRRGRARLRAATLAFGAAGLVAAGAVAYQLPSGTTSSNTAATAAGTSASPAVHAASGGSGVAASSTAGRGSAPAASTGRAHAASGGS